MDRFDGELGPASDEDLLRRFTKGEEAAFSELVRRHEDKIFALAYRITGDRAEALDATQETFISLFRRAGSFRGESAFATWLYRIGINAAYDALRRRRPTLEMHADRDEELRSSSASAMEEVAGIRSDIAGALAQLPLEYREAVVMHDLGDIPYEEIATLTKVSLGTVKSRISRGRRRLAELLEPSYRPETSKDQR
jgi:RNA polymerase sigma-70 factor (ECF subfamily)